MKGDGIGGRIAEAMREASISNNGLATLLKQQFGDGAPKRQAIADYISSKSSPTAATIRAIAAVLRVSPAWLLTGEGRSEPTDIHNKVSAEPWIPVGVRDRLAAGSRIAAVTTMADSGNDWNEQFYLEGTVGFNRWIVKAVQTAYHEAGRTGAKIADIAASFEAEGRSRTFGDALLLLTMAHEHLVWPLLGTAATPTADDGSDSVASSVGNAHNSTEKKRKRPKSKKGQPRG